MQLRKRLQIILDRRIKSVTKKYSSIMNDPFLGEIKVIDTKGVMLSHHFQNRINKILAEHKLEPIKSKHLPNKDIGTIKRY